MKNPIQLTSLELLRLQELEGTTGAPREEVLSWLVSRGLRSLTTASKIDTITSMHDFQHGRRNAVLLPVRDTESETPCSRCQRRFHDDGSRITWCCHVCKQNVCRGCTLTVPHSSPLRFYELTLCSSPCWERAGMPED